MCDLHPNCATVSILESANIAAPSSSTPPADLSPSAPPPGFMALTEEEYASTIRQEPIENYYEVNEMPLSEGRWASVYKCRLRETGAEFAAKFCNKLRLGMCAQQEILHEVAALRHCRRCPRIVQLFQVFETEHQYILVMEFGRGGDLQAILDDNQVPYENDVVRFMKNLLEGLVFIHERNMAHLDIKPQNVVLTGEFPDCDVKLCDLEISRVISHDQEIREMLGTPDYVAPEILRFDPVTLTADIWSVGVLAYVLLTGFTPFGGDTDSETFRNISKAELDFPDELFEDVSELAKDFIRRCLVKDARGRLSARQSLMHPWLQQSESAITRAPSVHGSNQSIISTTGDCFGSTDSVRTLRRSISKSREVICEKVTNSNLKKNISKSRERLCDLKFGLSKSRDRIPSNYRGVSRSSEVLSTKPPWRAAGVNCPLGKPLPPPMERMGSFKVREQYQSQVVAGLGSTQSLTGFGAPFVRHCSLRKRKQQQQQSQEIQPADFRSSLRRNKKNDSNQNHRRNSLQMDSSKMDEEKIKDMRRRSHSNRDETEIYPTRPERKRDSRRENSLTPDEGKNMIIVEIISDGEEEDVFTRLYKDRLKDSELKWRKLRDSDFDREDDEKENKSTNKSDLRARQLRRDDSPSRESVISQRGSKSGSDEALVDRLNRLPSSSEVSSSGLTENEAQTRPSISKPWTDSSNNQSRSPSERVPPDDQPFKPPVPPVPETCNVPLKFGTKIDNTDAKTVSKMHRRRSLTEWRRSDSEDGACSRVRRPRGSSDTTVPTATATNPDTHTVAPILRQSSALEGHSDRLRESIASWRKNKSTSPARPGRRSSASPEPSMHSRRQQRSSLVLPAAEQSKTPARPFVSSEPHPLPRSVERSVSRPQSASSSEPHQHGQGEYQPEVSASSEAVEHCRISATTGIDPDQSQNQLPSEQRKSSGPAISHQSVNTDPVATRDRGINTDTVLLAAVVDEDGLWERTEVLSTDSLRDCAPLETPRLAIEPFLPERRSPERLARDQSPPLEREQSPRHASVPPSAPAPPIATPLSKSSTDEDVHRRVRAGGNTEKRSVAFVGSTPSRAAGPQRDTSASSACHRSSSLSSDLGSSEFSSETGSDSYCIVSWEEAAAAPTSSAAPGVAGAIPADRATELKPIVTTRTVSRPRSQSTQMGPLESAQLRQRGRSNSVTTEQPFSAAQPWGALCSGSVARAFQKFHSISGEQRQKRRQSSPNIATFGAKVSDLGQV